LTLAPQRYSKAGLARAFQALQKIIVCVAGMATSPSMLSIDRYFLFPEALGYIAQCRDPMLRQMDLIGRRYMRKGGGQRLRKRNNLKSKLKPRSSLVLIPETKK